MSVTLPDCLVAASDPAAEAAVPVLFLGPENLEETLAGGTGMARAWVAANGFKAGAGALLTIPDETGAPAAVLFGLGKPEVRAETPSLAGKLATGLADGVYRLEGEVDDLEAAILAFALGAYRFDLYARKSARSVRLVVPETVDAEVLSRTVAAVTLVRDLVNTPANDLGPAEIADAAEKLAEAHGAEFKVTVGDELLDKNFPMIHAVGRASTSAPRLIDIAWGDEAAPKVTLVGKGVAFDTGGLNLKPGTSMALMKKDMGGAANVLGLASMIMAAKLPVRLRVLIPAVENSVAGNAFRPGDVLSSRKGLTVEIGNTDAEGRLVLADALALADEEEPELVLDLATLTGAARVALGTDLPPFYTDDEDLAAAVAEAAEATADPLWRMPLWKPYKKLLESKIADINHISSGGFAGSMTAALFLARFVEKAKSWAHFDIYAWCPAGKTGRPEGGEAQAIRALFKVLSDRYPPA
ncbi:leucyl aminopeptidase [Rhodobium orientis]|uniref:Leucyl aminopeptidase n=1 Tax=Rhodobium orientis TaxID=34017 RepID=A0A327JQN9_9HYPH|nr:leucyl aminopeptidase family protein [Rhodobium orientis]MBB4304658.1 leucyl aminopeptidase [Rhodobium orientis]MBK5950033.1 leucyl aminopeptidase [Rhodobium orientis]RAI27724.1 leucyl aminopeptidase [Rhodobium orientis]